MSVENVDVLVDRVVDALNHRDSEALAGLADPEIEFHSRFASVEGRVYRGKAGIEQYFADIEETLAEVHFELDRIVGWSGDNLVVVIRTYVTGRGSGATFDEHSFQVWSFRDGTPWRNMVFTTLEEALEAAGLEDS